MGFQLGPGFLRKPPRGWLPARAHALELVAHDRTNPEGGGSGGALFDVWIIDVLWRVHPDGGTPYEFREERRAPMWVKPGAVAAGKRSFSFRVRPQHGLQAEVPIPCHVDPGDPHALWVDWDAAYELHQPVWERIARVEREVNRQRGGVDALLDRITNPFAGSARPEDAAYVEQARAVDREREAAYQAQVDAAQHTPEQVELRRRMEVEQRIASEGRQCAAIVVSVTDTGRLLEGVVPIHELVLDIDDGGTVRRIVYEHTSGARHAKRYQVGKQITVAVDPEDAGRVALLS